MEGIYIYKSLFTSVHKLTSLTCLSSKDMVWSYHQSKRCLKFVLVLRILFHDTNYIHSRFEINNECLFLIFFWSVKHQCKVNNISETYKHCYLPRTAGVAVRNRRFGFIIPKHALRNISTLILFLYFFCTTFSLC